MWAMDSLLLFLNFNLGSRFMITESTIYWITRLNYFLGFLYTLGILVIVGGIVLIIAWYSRWYSNEKHKTFRKKVKHPFLITLLGILFFISALFIPSTKEICIIKVLPKIVNNTEVKELPNKVVELANEWLDELKPQPKDNK